MFNPYIPVSRELLAYFANKAGEIYIAGEVVNVKNVFGKEDSFYHQAEAQSSVMTRTVESTTNYLHIHNSSKKKKMWARGEIEVSTCYVKCTAQAKGTFGWNSYKTTYYMRITGWNNEMLKTWRAEPPIVQHDRETRGQFYSTGKKSSGYRHPIGVKNATAFKALINLQMYSDGVGPISGTFKMAL